MITPGRRDLWIITGVTVPCDSNKISMWPTMVAEKKSQLSSCFHLCETASVKRQQKSLYPATFVGWLSGNWGFITYVNEPRNRIYSQIFPLSLIIAFLVTENNYWLVVPTPLKNMSYFSTFPLPAKVSNGDARSRLGMLPTPTLYT